MSPFTLTRTCSTMSAFGATANITIRLSAARTVRFISGMTFSELPDKLLIISMLHPIEQLAQDVADPFENAARLSRIVLLWFQDFGLGKPGCDLSGAGPRRPPRRRTLPRCAFFSAGAHRQWFRIRR